MNQVEKNQILVMPRPLHDLSVEKSSEFISELSKRLSGRVEAAYVFGSILSEAFDQQSDLDLILVVRTERPFFKRIHDFFDITELGIPIDLFIYTPEEFEKLKEEGLRQDSGFWHSVVNSMKKI